MSLKIVTIVVLICSSVSSFHYEKDCVAKNGLDTDGIRTSWNIRFWVFKGETGNLLTLISENPPKFSLRRIDITGRQVHYFSSLNTLSKHNSTSIAGDIMSPGWKEVRVTSEERFRVWMKGLDTPLLDVEDGIQADRIAIFGSNVTVNCDETRTAWVASNNKEVFVPMNGLGRYDITVFSRTPFLPVMKLGHQLQLLSWDDKAKAVTTFALQPKPLPPFIHHNFTVQCNSEINHFKCTAVAGQRDTLVAYVYLLDETESFSFRGLEDEEFVIVLRHEDGLSNNAKTNYDLKGRLMARDVRNLQKTNSSLIVTLATFSLIIILLLVYSSILYFKIKKRKTKSERYTSDLEGTNTSSVITFLSRNINEETDGDTCSNADEEKL